MGGDRPDPGDRDRPREGAAAPVLPGRRVAVLQGFPGFHHDGHAPRASQPWPRIEYWPALLESALLDHHAVLDDGSRVEVPRASRTATPDETAQPVHPEPDLPAPTGPPVELGEYTWARAGDKGGNANVGVWCRDPAHWDWLRATLTTERAAALLPEAEGRIVRHEFPHLRAVHLVCSSGCSARAARPTCAWTRSASPWVSTCGPSTWEDPPHDHPRRCHCR
ncbi:hypothetical protein [Pseudonocardia sp. ICBG601]|uniref:AtuA-related protein n=1 Tax=Pseudonocardia sp. ICBG601 TaxID=2846759 RepID=UPI001CF6B327|nr:hypothetical protein [Pseudonocardia sp. ICBG601]